LQALAALGIEEVGLGLFNVERKGLVGPHDLVRGHPADQGVNQGIGAGGLHHLDLAFHLGQAAAVACPWGWW
jgi:hypothetical protein